jgi:hypothetical protein
MRRKILIVISGPLFERNYLSTPAFKGLESSTDCYYLLQRALSDCSLGPPLHIVGYYELEKRDKQKEYRLFRHSMIHFRHRSNSFVFRFMRGREMPQVDWAQQGLWPNLLKWSKQRLHRVITGVELLLFSNRHIYRFAYNRLRARSRVNTSIASAIASTSPDLVIFPSSSFDPEAYSITAASKASGVPTLFLVDNWDNLSSKTILVEKPDYVGVWGEQSVEHAITIQGINEESVFPIGTPRYDDYFKLRNVALPSLFELPYILFVGTALAFDEASVLKKLDSFVNDSDRSGKLIIVYRPHPWRQGTDTIDGLNLRNVMVDPQVRAQYFKGEHSDTFQPDLTYYPNLIKNALFVVGGLTSMLIETTILYKKYVALVHDDGKNITSQHNARIYFTHCEGIEIMDNILFCDDLSSLDAILSELCQDSVVRNPKELDARRQYFLYHDGGSYQERLERLCHHVIGLRSRGEGEGASGTGPGTEGGVRFEDVSE